MRREDGRRPARRWSDERGSALVFALLAMTLLTVLGGAVVVATVTETAIAARHREGIDAFYAAESALAHTLLALDREADWDGMVSGSAWRRYVEAPLADLIGAAGDSPVVTVWLRDAGGGQVEVRVRAAHDRRARVVEATVARRDGSTRVLSWRDGR
jgi:PilX N-terminal